MTGPFLLVLVMSLQCVFVTYQGTGDVMRSRAGDSRGAPPVLGGS